MTSWRLTRKSPPSHLHLLCDRSDCNHSVKIKLVFDQLKLAFFFNKDTVFERYSIFQWLRTIQEKSANMKPCNKYHLPVMGITDLLWVSVTCYDYHWPIMGITDLPWICSMLCKVTANDFQKWYLWSIDSFIWPCVCWCYVVSVSGICCKNKKYINILRY